MFRIRQICLEGACELLSSGRAHLDAVLDILHHYLTLNGSVLIYELLGTPHPPPQKVAIEFYYIVASI